MDLLASSMVLRIELSCAWYLSWASWFCQNLFRA